MGGVAPGCWDRLLAGYLVGSLASALVYLLAAVPMPRDAALAAGYALAGALGVYVLASSSLGDVRICLDSVALRPLGAASASALAAPLIPMAYAAVLGHDPWTVIVFNEALRGGFVAAGLAEEAYRRRLMRREAMG